MDLGGVTVVGEGEDEGVSGLGTLVTSSDHTGTSGEGSVVLGALGVGGTRRTGGG